MSLKETGRLTVTTFNRLYSHYKNTFDLEMRLTAARMTYPEAYKKAQEDEEWI